jgi:MOSC domain-containing protein YiiM
MNAAFLQAIYLVPSRGQVPQPVAVVRAVPGKGLEGDRYYLGRGSFSRWPGARRAASFIEGEALEAVRREFGIDLGDGLHRRNLVTHGVSLAALQGRTFRIGTAVFRGVGPCAPCRYLERLAGPGVFDALKGRGGLRAEIVEAGVLHVGDLIELMPGYVLRQGGFGGRPTRTELSQNGSVRLDRTASPQAR